MTTDTQPPQKLQWRSPHGRALPEGAHTLIMGILNTTPDSFSDGGQLTTTDAILARARALLAAGADVLDIGGESTRPGHTPVDEAGELARVLPAIEAVRRAFPDAPISIDTRKSAVARAAILAGADIVNDISGGFCPPGNAGILNATGSSGTGESPVLLEPTGESPVLLEHTASPHSSGGGTQPLLAHEISRAGCPRSRENMARVVAWLRCPVILAHNRPAPDCGDLDNFWPALLAGLRASACAMLDAGVAPGQIWLDPGFGFAKTDAQNLEVLKNLSRITALGHPVLLGTSRKSTIGRVLGQPAPAGRDAGTAATLVWGIQQGARMVRVHDVAAMRPFVEMAGAIRAGAAWEGRGFSIFDSRFSIARRREDSLSGTPPPIENQESKIENPHTHTLTLTLSRMRFHACHGALPCEKTQPQLWEVTVTLELPAGAATEAARADDLSKTTDYRRVHQITREVMQGPPLNLAETLAHRIAENLLRSLPVLAASVEVRKPNPPVDFESGGLAVRVRLEK